MEEPAKNLRRLVAFWTAYATIGLLRLALALLVGPPSPKFLAWFCGVGCVGIAVHVIVACHRAPGLRYSGIEAAAVFAFVMLVWALLVPIFEMTKESSAQEACFSSVKGICVATLAYANDHDERFPPARAWMDLLQPYAHDSFRCPAVHRENPQMDAYGLAYSRELSSKQASKVQDFAATPLSFDSIWIERNAFGGLELLPRPGRHYKRDTVGYADGHTKGERPYEPEMQP
jgi:hypothetical protein